MASEWPGERAKERSCGGGIGRGTSDTWLHAVTQHLAHLKPTSPSNSALA